MYEVGLLTGDRLKQYKVKAHDWTMDGDLFLFWPTKHVEGDGVSPSFIMPREVVAYIRMLDEPGPV
jgi:hypothetical protein